MSRWIVGRFDGDRGHGYLVRDVPLVVLRRFADWCDRNQDGLVGFVIGMSVGVLCFV